MTDNKLKDSEIIKGLEIYIACYGREIRVTDNVRIGNIYDLINRLQAENERLSKENIALNRRAIPSSGCILKVGNALLFAEKEEDYNTAINAIKAEAYKECIEKVKALFPSDNEPYQYWEIHEGADNLLKELVGESDG